MPIRHLAAACLLLLLPLLSPAVLPDSLRSQWGHLPDTAQIRQLLSRSTTQMYRNPVLARDYLGWAFELAEKPENRSLFPVVVKQRGTQSWVLGEHRAALADLRLAEKLYREAGDSLGVAKCQNNLGLVYQDMSFFDLAMAAYLKSATWFETRPDKYPLASLYNNIGNVCSAAGDSVQAQRWYTQSLELFTALRDTNGMAMVHNNLGLVLKDGPDRAVVLGHYEAALAGYEALHYPSGQAKVLSNLAAVYMVAGQFEVAESLALRSLHLGEQMQSPGEMALSQLKLSEVYLRWGRYAQAVSLARASLETGQGSGARLALASAHEVLALASEKTGDYAEALVHFKAHTALRDSIFNEKSSRALEEMKIRYDMALKDQELERYAQSQRLDTLWKRALWTVILLLVVGGIILYSRQRAIIRRELALQQKEREVFETQQALAAAELKAATADLNAAASEKQRLEDEVRYKTREISNLAMNIVRQHELLEVLDRELKELRKSPQDQKLREISQMVTQSLSLDQERKEFQLYIQEAQQTFFLRLEARYPDLSPREKRLCAMILLGLASKEIAVVLNIEPASVEVARHRLRRKLGLDANTGLREFLEQI